MNLTGCTKDDYDQIVSELSDFLGHDRHRPLHHPIFVNEFSDCAFVVRDQATVVAYLFGCIASAAPVAYVHLGLARQRYDHFTRLAVAGGCRQLRAITNPENAGSIRFHRALGFQLEGVSNAARVPVVEDYGGPGVDRVVFRKSLEGASSPGAAADAVHCRRAAQLCREASGSSLSHIIRRRLVCHWIGGNSCIWLLEALGRVPR